MDWKELKQQEKESDSLEKIVPKTWLSVSGRPGTGKTWLGLSASKHNPVVLFNFDLNEQGAIQVLKRYKQNILQFKYPLRLMGNYEISKDSIDQFCNFDEVDPTGHYIDALGLTNNSAVLFIDTATALLDNIQEKELFNPEAIIKREKRAERRADRGSSVSMDPQQFDYKKPNNQFEFLLSRIKSTTKHLILSHRMSPIYSESGKFTGQYTPDQYKWTPHLVNLEVLLENTDKGVQCKIVKSGIHLKLMGKVFPYGVYDFNFLHGISWNITENFTNKLMLEWAKLVQDGVYADSETGDSLLTDSQEDDFSKLLPKILNGK